jgi:hypothetical protein
MSEEGKIKLSPEDEKTESREGVKGETSNVNRQT